MFMKTILCIFCSCGDETVPRQKYHKQETSAHLFVGKPLYFLIAIVVKTDSTEQARIILLPGNHHQFHGHHWHLSTLKMLF